MHGVAGEDLSIVRGPEGLPPHRSDACPKIDEPVRQDCA
jgi:hypothetical protein